MSIAIVTMYGGARLAQDVRSGAFDRFRGLPIWRGAFVLGGLLGDAARYLFAAAIVVVLGLIMGYRADGGALGVLAAVALVVAFGFALSLLWTVVALVIHDPAVVISIANAVLIPLSFASNIFVQPGTMPAQRQSRRWCAGRRDRGGLSVPADLSVTGFDDIDLAQATTPPLTTVRQPLQEMGRIAVGLIIRLLERHQLEALHIELGTEAGASWFDRASDVTGRQRS
jgi:ABC-type multidrug transport system permease subunit